MGYFPHYHIQINIVPLFIKFYALQYKEKVLK